MVSKVASPVAVQHVPKMHRKSKQTCACLNFLRKIWELVKWIFKSLGRLCRKPKIRLTTRERTLIQSKVERRLEEITLAEPEAKPPVSPPSAVPVKLEEPPLEFPPIKDPVFEDFFRAAQGLFLRMTEVFFDERIKPVISKMDLQKAPEILKFIAEVAVTVGDKAAKPLFEKLSLIKEKVSPELIHALKWLLKDWKKADFGEKLGKILEKQFDTESELNAFLSQLATWFFDSDHKKSIHEHLQNDFPSTKYEKTIDKAFEASLLLLIDKKIQIYVKLLRSKLENLSSLLRTTMTETVERISSILLHRIIQLIQEVPFSQLFDEVLNATLAHSEAIIEFEKNKESAKQECTKELKDAKAAKKSRKMPDHERQEITDEKRWIEETAEQKALQKYAERADCHIQIASLIKNPQLPTVEKNKLIEELFEHTAAGLIPLLLPPQKVMLPNGEVKDVDALIFLLSQFRLPSEFKELISEAVNIFQGIISKDTQQVVKSISHKIVELAYSKFEEIILAETRKMMKKGIMQALRLLFDHFLSRESIDQMMSTEALPSLHKVLLRALGQHAISNDKRNFAPLFYDLANDQNPLKSHVEILERLFHKVKAYCHKYNLEALSRLDFGKIMEPLMEEIRDAVLTHQKLKENKNEKLALEALEGYFGTVYPESIPLYNKLLRNLVFEIGDLGSTLGCFSSLFNGTIDAELTAAVHPYRKTSHQLVGLATKKFAELNQAHIKTLLFPEHINQTDDPAEKKLKISLKLNDELEKTAKLIHDLANIKAGAGIQLFIPNPALLYQVIHAIYEKVLGHELVTQNFLVRAQEIALQKFVEAAKRVDAHPKVHMHKVARMPNLIPEPFAALIFTQPFHSSIHTQQPNIEATSPVIQPPATIMPVKPQQAKQGEFKLGAQTWLECPTNPNGDCALHASFGEIDEAGLYTFKEGREKFIKGLEDVLESPAESPVKEFYYSMMDGMFNDVLERIQGELKEESLRAAQNEIPLTRRLPWDKAFQQFSLCKSLFDQIKIKTKEKKSRIKALIGIYKQKLTDFYKPHPQSLNDYLYEYLNQEQINFPPEIPAVKDVFSQMKSINAELSELEAHKALSLKNLYNTMIPFYLQALKEKKGGSYTFWFENPEVRMAQFIFEKKIHLFIKLPNQTVIKETQVSSVEERVFHHGEVCILYNGENHYSRLQLKSS